MDTAEQELLECICCGKWLPNRTWQQHARDLAESNRHPKRKRSSDSLGEEEDRRRSAGPSHSSAGPSLSASPSGKERQGQDSDEEHTPPLSDPGIHDISLEGMELEAGPQRVDFEAVMAFEEDELRLEDVVDDREDPAAQEPGDWGVDDDQFDSESESEEAPEDWRRRWEEEWLAEDRRSGESHSIEHRIFILQMLL